MIRTLYLLFFLSAATAFIWAVSKGADAIGSPLITWLFIGAIAASVLFLWGREFVRGVDAFREVTQAYAQRQIQDNDLPSEFRFITHATTLAEVTQKLGPPSRVLQLGLPHRDGDTEHFIAHQYNLPYRAAVFIMPQRPFEAEDKIRAVSVRSRPKDDEVI